MYVCICNGYRDAEITEVARGGVRCARRAYFELGRGPRCGQCLEMAQDIIDDVHEANAAPQLTYETEVEAEVSVAIDSTAPY